MIHIRRIIMEKQEKILNEFLFNISLNGCILDIETTGLSKYKEHIVCIGVIYQDEDHIKLIQWFAHQPDEEAQILSEFLFWLQNLDTVYTYGGSKFDLPFFTYRLAYHHLAQKLPRKLNFTDMSKLPILNYKNKGAFEMAVSYKRSISLSGRDVTKLYKVFQKQQRIDYKELILSHNLDELKLFLYAFQIYNLFTQLQTKVLEVKTDYLETKTQYTLLINTLLPCNYSFTKDNIEILLKKDKNECILSIKPTKLCLKKYLYPIKDYYYIPSQKKIMHKSIAAFIPKELKEKANKDNCFILEEDYFIKVYEKKGKDSQLWYDDNHNPYILYSDFIKNDNIMNYIMSFCQMKNTQ